MARIDWDGCLPDDPVLCRHARLRLDNRAPSIRSMAVSTARMGWPVPHLGGTRGPRLVDGAVVVMAPGLADRFPHSRSRGSGVRDDNRLSIGHCRGAPRLCCLLVK